METEIKQTENQTLVDLGQRLAEPRQVGVNGSVLAAVVPEGHKLSVEDIEQYQERPRRVVRTVHAETAESFARYFAAYAQPESVVALTRSGDTGTFAGIIDYHDKRRPAWGQHRVEYTPKITKEWQVWRDSNAEKFGQQEFAEFLENNRPDITQPDAATLLEIVKTLEGRKSVNFKAGLRLDNGDHQLRWEETTETMAGLTGELEIPSAFEVTIPLFYGGNPAALPTRLKYRLSSGSVVFWYELIRPHKAVEAQFETLKQIILAGIGEHEFFEGKL